MVTATNILEQDKHVLRAHIVDAVSRAPAPIRVALSVCMEDIARKDFPAKWTSLVDDIASRLRADQPAHAWLGALTCLYRLVKCYE